MSRLTSQSFLVAVALVSGMVAAGAIGWHLGAREGLPSAPGPDAGSLGAQAREAAAAADRLARMTHERDTARASVAALRDHLAEAERRRADDAADLALYRRLGDESATSGLSIDTVNWRLLDGQTLLDITLVQAKGRSRVGGTLGVSVLQGGEPARRVELVPDEGEAAIPFDLRFFQTVSVPLDASLGAAPPSGGLAISVRPDGEMHPAFVDIRSPDAIIDAVAGE